MFSVRDYTSHCGSALFRQVMNPFVSMYKNSFSRRTLSLCFFLAALLPSAVVAQDTVQVNIATAIERAVTVSPEVGDVAAGRDFAEARWQFARANQFLPELSLNTAHSFAPGLKGIGDTPTDQLYLNPDVRNDWDNLSPFSSIEGEAIQPIYTWGEISQSIRAARYGVDLEAGAVRSKEDEIALRTGELYTSLLLTEELYRLTDRIGDVLDQAKGEIQRLLDEGDEGVDDADLFQVQISEQEFFRRVVEVDQQRETARMAMRRQLVLPDDVVLVPEQVVLEPLAFTLDSLDTYFAIAMDNRAELMQARAGLEARASLVNVAKSDYYPKLFFGVNGGIRLADGRFRQPSPYVGDAFRGRTFQAGVGIQQSLNFTQTRAKVEQARAEMDQARYQGEAAELLILFEVEEAYRNFIVEQAALEAQKESLRLSREWLLTESNNFEFDLGDTENLVRAVQASLQLEATYFEAVQRHNVSILRLLDACGVLTRQALAGTFVE